MSSSNAAILLPKSPNMIAGSLSLVKTSSLNSACPSEVDSYYSLLKDSRLSPSEPEEGEGKLPDSLR